MLINTNNLHSNSEKNRFLTHVMLDSDLAPTIAGTLEGKEGDERTVEVKLSFNGVAVDAQKIEDMIQYQWKKYKEKVDAEYADIEALVQQRAEKIAQANVTELAREQIARIDKARELLDNLELDLFCI